MICVWKSVGEIYIYYKVYTDLCTRMDNTLRRDGIFLQFPRPPDQLIPMIFSMLNVCLYMQTKKTKTKHKHEMLYFEMYPDILFVMHFDIIRLIIGIVVQKATTWPARTYLNFTFSPFVKLQLFPISLQLPVQFLSLLK